MRIVILKTHFHGPDPTVPFHAVRGLYGHRDGKKHGFNAPMSDPDFVEIGLMRPVLEPSVPGGFRGISTRSLHARDELLEPRVLAQRIEVGVDPEPAGREEVGDLQQRLELVQRLLRSSRPRLGVATIS